jgi:hypothetical protein
MSKCENVKKITTAFLSTLGLLNEIYNFDLFTYLSSNWPIKFFLQHKHNHMLAVMCIK